jgi:hypothetical protein
MMLNGYIDTFPRTTTTSPAHRNYTTLSTLDYLIIFVCVVPSGNPLKSFEEREKKVSFVNPYLFACWRKPPPRLPNILRGAGGLP